MFAQLQQVAVLFAAQGEGPPAGCPKDQFLPLLIMLGIMYFIWIRPANKERKTHQDMLATLKRGDEVVTSSGMFGTIADITESVIVLEVSKNVKIRVLRSAISKRSKDLKSAKEDKEDKKDNKSAKAS